MRRLRIVAALVAVPVLHAWHALLTVVGGRTAPAAADQNAGQVADSVSERTDGGTDERVVEHERGWYDYLRGFHAHHGDPGSYGVPETAGDGPEYGSLWHGLDAWWQADCLRGYTLGDHVYVCPGTPRAVRVHQAGHAPSFGAAFETLAAERRANGGLPDEPLRTLDVMLPGRFPHTFCRLRDPRGLQETYAGWLRDGRIVRLPG